MTFLAWLLSAYVFACGLWLSEIMIMVRLSERELECMWQSMREREAQEEADARRYETGVFR